VVALNDAVAFGELVRRHQSQVRNFLRKLCRDVTLADDLAQDTFLHAWNKLHTYTRQGSFIGWLLKVAYTTFLQSKRKSSRYGEILDEYKQGALIEDSGSHSKEEVSDLDKYLAVLGEQERAIMILAYACELSHHEIGQATDLPIGTVKSHIHRSKEKIRQSFNIQEQGHG
jgi:RNA polymerase sigma-70 factor (ECF subfamily)